MHKLISVDALCRYLGEKGVQIGSSRILDLAESGYLPCIYVDGCGPFFRRFPTITWIEKNLIEQREVKTFPKELRVLKSTQPEVGDVPQSLSLLAENLLRFPPVQLVYPPCVYFLVNDETVVYVGQSVSLFVRIATHAAEGKTFDSTFYLPVPRGALNEVEMAFIVLFKAKYNRQPADHHYTTSKRNVIEAEHRAVIKEYTGNEVPSD